MFLRTHTLSYVQKVQKNPVAEDSVATKANIEVFQNRQKISRKNNPNNSI